MELEQDSALPIRDSHPHRLSDAASDATQAEGSSTTTLPEASSSSRHTENAVERSGDIIRKFLGETAAASDLPIQNTRPLNLLDLPWDVLSLICKEITHTNDLCALALSHSALHSLAIPFVYSRFDIVWPEANSHAEPRAGVDALTYGLATLVMCEDVFGEPSVQQNRTNVSAPTSPCSRCGHSSSSRDMVKKVPLGKRKRRGNNYASFTRKFSLGNGPADWVKEYSSTGDSGKMLGTLVALAIGRMRNLETFIWDMPTGVLRDVWQALASLGDHADCRLEKLWIRWHSNSLVEGNIAPPRSPPHDPNTLPQPISAGNAAVNTHKIVNKVERSTFSILPPLRSLNVLDIDELAYLDEMSVLISDSRHTLRELRVGIAKEASGCDWTGAWEGSGLQQLPAKTANPLGGTNHFEKRLGGVLGVLVTHTYSLGPNPVQDVPTPTEPRNETVIERQQIHQSYLGPTVSATMAEVQSNDTLDANMAQVALEYQSTKGVSDSVKAVAPRFVENFPPVDSSRGQASNGSTKKQSDEVESRASISEKDNFRLRVEILELERVPISVAVLCTAFDWSKLAELTVLDCANHEQLWRVLRRKFAPRAEVLFGTQPTDASGRRSSKSTAMDYELRLRKIQTNAVSSSLISFLKETLGPNTLESLFLQQSKYYTSKVSINQIFRGPIRRHHASLKHLSIDSRYRDREEGTIAVGYGKWEFDRELLTYITSGRMSSLRELAMSLHIKDWHYFLQRLQWIPHLRSLYIPFVSKDSAHVPDQEAKELALQVVDIVTLRPEIELCYLALANKCFELLEARPASRAVDSDDSSTYDSSNDGESSGGSMHDDDDEDDIDAANGDNDGAAGSATIAVDEDDEDTETEEETASDDDDEFGILQNQRSQMRLRLREILFYDDKISIFKARHGRL